MITFDEKLEEVLNLIASIAPDFEQHFVGHMLPILKENMNTIWENPQFIGFHWTNNNSESLNHILKMSINWTPQALINLIETLRNVVGGLYQDVTRAIVGRGQFRLAEDFSHFFYRTIFLATKN